MNSRRFLPVLFLLFVGSGCAALIYEIVWFQLLQLVIGSSAISLGILLGTFMGGMCLGSLLFSRMISARQREAAETHAAHERAEQDAERDGRRSDDQLQQLEPDDLVNQRRAAAANKKDDKSRKIPA